MDLDPDKWCSVNGASVGCVELRTTYVLRFVKALKSRIQSSVTDVPGTLSLGATEISEAQKLWIIESQLFAKDTNFDTWDEAIFLDVWSVHARAGAPK